MRPYLHRIGMGRLLGVLISGLLCPPQLHAQVESPAPTQTEPIQPGQEQTEVGREDTPVLKGAESLSDWARLQLERTGATSTGGSRTLRDRIEGVRAMYFLSVDEGDWVDTAKDSIALLRDLVPAESADEAILQGYRGAIEVVRAKHSRWPPNKLKYLNRGAAILDHLIGDHPEDLELRYLRLASYRFLPFFLSRDESVAEDLKILVANLPQEPDAFSPPIYRAVLQFVLENSEMEEEDRTRFELALGTGPTADGDTDNGR